MLLMGKSTMSTWVIFNSKLLVYQRVSTAVFYCLDFTCTREAFGKKPIVLNADLLVTVSGSVVDNRGPSHVPLTEEVVAITADISYADVVPGPEVAGHLGSWFPTRSASQLTRHII